MDPMSLLIYLAIIVILIVVAWYLLSKVALPEPAGTIIQIAIVVIVAVVVIGILLQFAGHGGIRLR